MPRISRSLSLATAAICASLPFASAHAQMAVIDGANLAQAVQNVIDDAERFEQLAQTINQLRTTHDALTGLRNLAASLNDPLLQNYLPPMAYTLLNDVGGQGYAGLTQRARQLRDAGMVYNCQDRTGVSLQACQGTLAAPYQYKALVNDAQDRSSRRTDQINALMRQAASTADPKAIAEAQARIQAETALLAHENTPGPARSHGHGGRPAGAQFARAGGAAGEPVPAGALGAAACAGIPRQRWRLLPIGPGRSIGS